MKCLLVVVAAALSAAVTATPESDRLAPVADAGPSRYAGSEPIVLDGRGSKTADGGELQYHWRQISGPAVVIGDPGSPIPEIRGFVPELRFQTIEIGLVVDDGFAVSDEDAVEITVVPMMAHATLKLVNPPFREDLPTLVTFGGGDCVDGIHMPLNASWQARFNIITGPYFFPYVDHAYQLVVMMSAFAPDYEQPIQTVGFSTGGNPASVVPLIVNRYFRDPRYAVNRMTLLDTWCDDDLATKVADFNSNPVPGETAWVEVLRSFPEPIPGALNISFFPGGDHGTPQEWFVGSIEEANWPDGDSFNGGVTAGFVLSVGGPGRRLQLANGGLQYYFECPELDVGCLRRFDPELYPGLIPEPVTLIGPAHESGAGPDGELLTCAPSLNAERYELLIGPDPDSVSTVVSASAAPPHDVIADFPYRPTYWTIRVRDAQGSVISAEPRSIFAYETQAPRRILRRHRSGP